MSDTEVRMARGGECEEGEWEWEKFPGPRDGRGKTQNTKGSMADEVGEPPNGDINRGRTEVAHLSRSRPIHARTGHEVVGHGSDKYGMEVSSYRSMKTRRAFTLGSEQLGRWLRRNVGPPRIHLCSCRHQTADF